MRETWQTMEEGKEELAERERERRMEWTACRDNA